MLKAIAQALIAAAMPELKKFLADQFDEWMPKIIDAVVVSVTKTGMGIAQAAATNTVDKVTDLIPGQVDDQLLDPIIGNIFDQLRQRGIIR